MRDFKVNYPRGTEQEWCFMHDEDFMVVYDQYKSYGIVPRTLTEGEELDMVKSFVAFRRKTYHPSRHLRMVAFLEPKVSMHYPDVVFVEYDPSSYAEWNAERSKLRAVDYKVLTALCSRKQIGFSSLQYSLSMGTSDLRDSLEKLLMAGTVSARRNCYAVRRRTDWLGIHRIEAYEAKVDGFENALQQAISNAGFASESNILLKRRKHPMTCTMDRLSRLGIGLTTYNNNVFNRCVDAVTNEHAPLNYSFFQLNDWVGQILAAEQRTGEDYRVQ